MKINNKYHTDILINGNIVIIKKFFNDLCSYNIISSHSDIVKNDFFGLGKINKDYSLKAEEVLNSNICNKYKENISSYINNCKRYRGRGMRKGRNN